MIEVVNVSKTYHLKGQDIEALKNISFTVEDGRIVGIIGLNGAGKSTLIKILTGILYPSQGKCIVSGIVPYENREENAKNIGVMFGQKSQLWWDLPLIDSIHALKTIYDLDKTTYLEMFDFISKSFELQEILHQPVRTLSLGQRMRAQLACVLLHRPKVVFLDEPTIGLDLLIKHKILEAIKAFNKKYNTTFIITSHDMNDIESLCQDLIILNKGIICFHGSKEQFLATYNKTTTILIYTDDSAEQLLEELQVFCNLSFKKMNNGIKLVLNKHSDNINALLKVILKYENIKKLEILEDSLEDVMGDFYVAQ